jgi:hypothetical protein
VQSTHRMTDVIESAGSAARAVEAGESLRTNPLGPVTTGAGFSDRSSRDTPACRPINGHSTV